MPRGGAREGAGRPKGSKDPHTIEREAVLAEYRSRICQQAQRLLDAEMTVALGCSFLFCKRKADKKGERKVERVTSEETIRQYLNGELDNAEDEYYYITADKPDTLTIRGMFDRTFDKPGQRVAVTDGDGNALTVPNAVVFVVQQQKDSENRT